MEKWEEILTRVAEGERLSAADALTLWQDAPLWRLGEVAVARKRAKSGDKVFYNKNFHIEPTNICVFNCKFCSYRRPRGSAEAWDYTLEQIEDKVRSYVGKGATEMHIVGGVHPDHDLDFYCELIRRVKAILPGAAVKAYTAIELAYMIQKSGLTTEEGLKRLIEAGMEAIPGGEPRFSTRSCARRYAPTRALRPSGLRCIARHTSWVLRPTPQCSMVTSRRWNTASTT